LPIPKRPTGKAIRRTALAPSRQRWRSHSFATLCAEMGQDIKSVFAAGIAKDLGEHNNRTMAKKNKLASIIADLNYDYLSVVAKLCGEPVDSLIDRIVERAASKRKKTV